MVWNDERIELLKSLWAEGLTTGEIGKQLGVSKNAVVGKAHRLGLKGRPSPIKRTKKPAKPEAPPKQVEPPPSLVDLAAHTCRWPIGDPRDADFHFCGKPALTGKPYCGEHAAIAYVTSGSKSSSREEDAA
ncbi:GcrA family cell cycle regulator [Caenispirillum bisanense]|uniref:GcrA cell cycle regulator n=1 Tax=Caenispirillum bisanense TaxID=414052 RepID=A0A286GNU3_9PROT|nr:GcrA family cell cycle regulator [Caenispirillum bisanense]SOD96739.1 GcrA cell cycle regulator [Caenispirillum bisanense]